MPFTREINRLLAGVLLSFALVALAAAYWVIAGPDTLLARDDNPRRVLAEASILRGAIMDREHVILVQSTTSADGTATRAYLHPVTNGALGYYSLRYGAGGIEAAYDSDLRGANVEPGLADALLGGVLHRPPQGSDVRLSLDLDIQTVLAQEMDGYTGAAVVLGVPSGQILGMVSAPTYDPNTLDADWDKLRDAPGKPFFNRVVQGSYQPGGTLETALMAAALLSDQPLNEPLDGATAPVTVDELAVSCAVRLPEMALTLRDAYAFACPQPFAALAEQLGAQAVNATLDTFRLDDAPVLAGFTAPVDLIAFATSLPTPAPPPADDVVTAALGQGRLTVSPLAMAMLAAGIVNDGNAPQPTILLDIRAPGADVWDTARAIRPTLPVATTNTARQLQDLMRYAVATGAAQNAARPTLDIGGHVAVAYSGEGPQTWFVGFVTLPGRRGVAVAIVLENVNDPGLAADIGGTALAAAAQDILADAPMPTPLPAGN